MDWALYVVIAIAVAILSGVVAAYFIDVKRTRKKRDTKELLHMDLYCPRCRHRIVLDAPSRLIPKTIICPKCRERINVKVDKE